MDLLSIALGALSVAKLAGTCASKLHDLYSKHNLASLTLSSMSANALRYEHSSMKCNDTCEKQLLQQPHLRDAIDTFLTSFIVTFSILEIELGKISPPSMIPKLNGLRYLWKESSMKERLLQIRAQSSAIGRILTAIQCNITRGGNGILEENNNLLEISRTQQSNRVRYPDVNKRISRSVTKEIADSIHTESIDGGAKEFTFDAEIVNSRAYRELLGKLASNKAGQAMSELHEKHSIRLPISLPEEQVSNYGPEPPQYSPMVPTTTTPSFGEHLSKNILIYHRVAADVYLAIVTLLTRFYRRAPYAIASII